MPSPSKVASHNAGSSTFKRRQRFVDSKVQGSLLLRCVFYYVFCLASVFFMLLCWRIVTGPMRLFYEQLGETWLQFGPALLMSLLLLPIVAVDVIRLTNRFAGPMLRLRRAMRTLAQGERVEPVHFRDGDFWGDFAEDFNRVLARLQTERPEPTARGETLDQRELETAGTK
jgi:hypothetical protein